MLASKVEEACTNQLRVPDMLSEVAMESPARPALSVSLAEIAKRAAKMVMRLPRRPRRRASHRLATELAYEQTRLSSMCACMHSVNLA